MMTDCQAIPIMYQPCPITFSTVDDLYQSDKNIWRKFIPSTLLKIKPEDREATQQVDDIPRWFPDSKVHGANMGPIWGR